MLIDQSTNYVLFLPSFYDIVLFGGVRPNVVRRNGTHAPSLLYFCTQLLHTI